MLSIDKKQNILLYSQPVDSRNRFNGLSPKKVHLIFTTFMPPFPAANINMKEYSNYSDLDLLENVRADDRAAFSEMYNRYHAAVYAYLLGFVKVPELAEDILHDVFLKLWETRERINIHTSFSSFLFRTCHNQAVDMLRKISVDEQRRKEVLYHLKATESDSEIYNIDSKKYDHLVEEALGSLSPQCRRVFMMCRHEGKTFEETAQELGISKNTVKYHMKEAMRTLRNFLSNRGEVAFLLLVMEYFSKYL